MKLTRLFLTVSCLFFSLSGCLPTPDPAVRVGTNQWPGYETLYLARKLGYFDNTQVSLIELTSATEIINAFKNRLIDVAALTLDEVLFMAQEESDLRVFLILDISNGSDKLMVKSSIKQLSQLKDKCIAVENSALGAFVLHQVLKAAKLNISDIKVSSVDIDQHYPVFKNSDTCDAAITFEPMATKLKSLGMVDLYNSSQMPDKIVDVLVTRKSVIEQQRTNLHALVNAQWQALDYIKNNPEKAYQLIAPRLDLNPTEVAESYNGLILVDQKFNQELLSKQTPNSLSSTLYKLSEIMQRAKLITKHPLSIEQILSNKLVN